MRKEIKIDLRDMFIIPQISQIMLLENQKKELGEDKAYALLFIRYLERVILEHPEINTILLEVGEYYKNKYFNALSILRENWVEKDKVVLYFI